MPREKSDQLIPTSKFSQFPQNAAKVGHRRIIGVALLAAGLFLPFNTAVGARADDPPVVRGATGAPTVTVSQRTGTPDIDASGNQEPEDGPWGNGLDPGPNDNLVRTNDFVTWNVEVLTGAAQTNSVMVVELPQGVYMDQVPEWCDAGSYLTLSDSSGTELPAGSTVPAPAVPLTIDSWKDLPQQTLTCLYAKLNPANADNELSFQVKVRPEVPNGTDLQATIRVVSDQYNVPETRDFTVVSAPLYDLSKNGLATQADTGPTSGTGNPVNINGTMYSYTNYPIVIGVTVAGAKGIAPASSFTFVDDLTPAATYAQATNAATVISRAGSALSTYGVLLNGCGTTDKLTAAWNFGTDLPSSSGGDDTSASNTGTIQCTQSGGAGTPVQITISGGDYTGYHVPSKTGNGNAELPANSSVVVVGYINVLIPLAAIQDLGTGTVSSTTLIFVNNFTQLSSTPLPNVSASGEIVPETAALVATDDLANNHRKDPKVYTVQGTFDTEFNGVPGAAGNNVQNYKGRTEGPAQGSGNAGTGLVVPGQDILSTITFFHNDLSSARAAVVCDYWDNSLARLHLSNFTGGKVNEFWINSAQGSAVWNYVTYAMSYLDGNSDPTNVVIEYASLPSPSTGRQGCGDYEADGTTPINWTTNINDPRLGGSQNGVYNNINAVRISAVYPQVISDVVGAVWAINLQVNPDLASGVVIPSYASFRMGNPGQSTAQIIAANVWTASNYDPATQTGFYLGDRVTTVNLVPSLNKEILQSDRASGQYTSSITQVSVGQTRTFRLTPVLTSPVTGVQTDDVTVEDCVPTGFQLQSASPDWTTTDPNNAKAQLTCNPGEQYVMWDLGPQSVGTTIDPITYNVLVLTSAAPQPPAVNRTFTNTAMIWADGASGVTSDGLTRADIPWGATAASRTDTQQISVTCAAGLYPEKTPDVLQAQTGDDLTWQVSVTNLLAENITNVDAIDALPAISRDYSGGDPAAEGYDPEPGTTAVANSDATLALKAVAANTWPEKLEVYWTDVAPGDLSANPCDATNSSGGCSVPGTDPGTALEANTVTSIWHQVDFSTENLVGDEEGQIPSTATALRFKSDGPFTGDDSFSFSVTMSGEGLLNNDRIVNTMGTSAGGMPSIPIYPSTIEIQSSTIGDYVWQDTNRDGVQSDDEPALPDMPVTLTGCNDKGQWVQMETKTDENGHYEFTGLRASGTCDPDGDHADVPDGYTVTFNQTNSKADALTKYLFTEPSQGEDTAVDSDAIVNPDDVTIGAVTLQIGVAETNNDIDAGLYSPPPVISKDVSLADSEDSHDGGGVLAGQQLTWTLSFTNDYPVPVSLDATDDLKGVADDVTITMPASAGPLTVTPAADGLSFTVTGEIPAETTLTLTYTGTVKDDDSRGDSLIANFVFATGENPNNPDDPDNPNYAGDVPPTVDPDDPAATFNPVSAILLVKTGHVQAGQTGTEGDTVIFDFTITNSGQNTLTDVTLGDEKDGLSDITYDAWPDPANPGMLKPGEQVEAHATYTITAADVLVGEVPNTATASGFDKDGNKVTSESTTTVPTKTSPVISKDVSLADSEDSHDGNGVIAGQQLTWTLSFTNDYPVPVSLDATDDLKGVADDVTITMPASAGPLTVTPAADGLSFTVTGEIPAETTLTLTYTGIVKADGSRGDSLIANFVFATGENPNNPDDPDNPNYAGDVPPTVDPGDPAATFNPVSAILLVKTGHVQAGQTGTEGDTVIFDFTITNSGQNTLTDVTLGDEKDGLSDITYGDWPDSANPGMLKPGEQVEAHATYTITAADVLAGEVPNTAAASGFDKDGNKVTSESTTTVPTKASPDISLLKEALLIGGNGDRVANPGEQIVFRLTAKNTGDIRLTTVTVTDDSMNELTQGMTCTYGDEDGPEAINGQIELAPDEQVVCLTTPYTVTEADAEAGQVLNLATARGTIPGWQPSRSVPGGITGSPNPQDKSQVTVPASEPQAPEAPQVPDAPTGGTVVVGSAGVPAVAGLIGTALLLAGLGLVRRRRLPGQPSA